jgi:hypothetical protein
MVRIVPVCAAAALGVAGCASDRVDFGGVANPVALNGPVVDCEASGLRMTERGALTFPASLLRRAYYTQNRSGFQVEIPFTYDVTAAGEAVNVQFSGDPDMTRDGALRDAILFASDSLLNSEFEWPQGATAAYARGCTETINFGSRVAARP